MFIFVFLSFTVIASLLHLFAGKQPRTSKRIIEIVLSYLLFFNVGLGGLWAFIGHAFMADEVARSIGWQPGSPFQFEVAVANLAFGILGVLSFWVKGKFRLASVIGVSVFLLGAAYGHIVQMSKGNFAPNNTGVLLYIGDIAIPVIMLILVIIYIKQNK
jgi:hypothetical protein